MENDNALWRYNLEKSWFIKALKKIKRVVSELSSISSISCFEKEKYAFSKKTIWKYWIQISRYFLQGLPLSRNKLFYDFLMNFLFLSNLLVKLGRWDLRFLYFSKKKRGTSGLYDYIFSRKVEKGKVTWIWI